MFDEKSIAPSLEELGYLRPKKLTYKASWGSIDVEHFLFFSLYGGGDYFVCYFGIRNPAAERFAFECLRLFGGSIFQDGRFDLRYRCCMQFSLGGLAEWGPRWSLNISGMSESALAHKVKGDIRDLLFPVVRSVLSPADLFALLIKDVEPCRWVRVSGALRAAMIVYLGGRLGMQTSEIESVLQPYLKEIAANMGQKSMARPESPSSFLKKILDYSNSLDRARSG